MRKVLFFIVLAFGLSQATLLHFTIKQRDQAIDLAERCSKDLSSTQAEVETNVKQAATVGFVAGCVITIKDIKRVDDSDPLIPVYQDWCVHFAKEFAKQVEMK